MAITPHSTIRGGYYTSTAYSGLLGDVALTLSGQSRGRLNTITFFNYQALLSGGNINFYDGANAGVTLASGGPYATSGHIMLYQLPQWPNSSAISGQNAPLQTPINVDAPFFSGLNVAYRSGTPGFTVSWSVERPLY